MKYRERTNKKTQEGMDDRQSTDNVTLRSVRVIIVAVENQKSITYSECVSVALFTQNAKRMRRIIFSTVASLAPPYFSTLSHKCHDFRKKKKKGTEYKTRVLIFSTTFA
jgi:hypothetical protein